MKSFFDRKTVAMKWWLDFTFPANSSGVLQEALALWEERERQRAEFLLTLGDARASVARGEGRIITQESMQQLATEVKERGRARLLAELTTSR